MDSSERGLWPASVELALDLGRGAVLPSPHAASCSVPLDSVPCKPAELVGSAPRPLAEPHFGVLPRCSKLREDLEEPNGAIIVILLRVPPPSSRELTLLARLRNMPKCSGATAPRCPRCEAPEGCPQDAAALCPWLPSSVDLDSAWPSGEPGVFSACCSSSIVNVASELFGTRGLGTDASPCMGKYGTVGRILRMLPCGRWPVVRARGRPDTALLLVEPPPSTLSPAAATVVRFSGMLQQVCTVDDAVLAPLTCR